MSVKVITTPCVDGVSGHAVEFGRGGVLHEDHPRFLLDGLETQGTIGTHSRENDANAPLPPVVRQGAEEEVNGQAQAPGRRRVEEVQYPVEDGYVLVGRYHIDVVRLNYRAVLHLYDLHGGGALEELGHDPLVRRVEVLDDDKGHAASLRHVLQELFEGLQPSGGGADAHDGEGPVPVPEIRLLCRAGGRSLYLPPGFRSLCHGLLPPFLPGPDRIGMFYSAHALMPGAFFVSGLKPLCTTCGRLIGDRCSYTELYFTSFTRNTQRDSLSRRKSLRVAAPSALLRIPPRQYDFKLCEIALLHINQANCY